MVCVFAFVHVQVVLWVAMKPRLFIPPHDPGLSSKVITVKKLTNRITNVYGQRINPCQSSFSLIECIVVMLAGTEPGAHILDLGAGTFTTATVCAALGHHCTSIEKNREACNMGVDRIKAVVVKAKDAFMKPFKAPCADFISVASAKNVDNSYLENPNAFVPKPYIAPGSKFSYLSSAFLRDLMVGLSQKIFPFFVHAGYTVCTWAIVRSFSGRFY